MMPVIALWIAFFLPEPDSFLLIKKELDEGEAAQGENDNNSQCFEKALRFRRFTSPLWPCAGRSGLHILE